MKVFRLLLILLSILTVVLGFFAVIGKLHVFPAIFSLLVLLVLLLIFFHRQKNDYRHTDRKM